MASNSAKAKPLASGLAVSGIDASVEVRRHPAARRLTLRVSRTRRAVIVTLPIGSDFGDAGSFVNTHIDWVRARLQDVPDPMPFADGGAVPVRGTLHRLRFVAPRAHEGVVRVHTPDAGEGELVLPVIEVSGRAEHAPRRLKDWLEGEARKDLDERVRWHAHRIGVRPRRITLRDQKSRWGSCSSAGQLSFSWRLVLAPSLILDYVAAHEVAHLAEMNHGPRFWRLVNETMPRMEEARTWLREHGMELHRYGYDN